MAKSSCDTCTWLLYNRALTLKASFRSLEAVETLNALLDIDSLDSDAWLMLGQCYFLLAFFFYIFVTKLFSQSCIFWEELQLSLQIVGLASGGDIRNLSQH